MTNIEVIKKQVSESEGIDKLLYSNPHNPYESVYIRAKISDGKLTVTYSMCEHGPDGGWSHHTISFDRENTEKVFDVLLDKKADPFQALAEIIRRNAGTGDFLDICNTKGIRYKMYYEW